jgi:hypothetical protein
MIAELIVNLRTFEWRWRPRIRLNWRTAQNGAAMSDNTPSPLDNVITIDRDRMKNHLDRSAGQRGEGWLRQIGCAMPSTTSAASLVISSASRGPRPERSG